MERAKQLEREAEEARLAEILAAQGGSKKKKNLNRLQQQKLEIKKAIHEEKVQKRK